MNKDSIYISKTKIRWFLKLNLPSKLNNSRMSCIAKRAIRICYGDRKKRVWWSSDLDPDYRRRRNISRYEIGGGWDNLDDPSEYYACWPWKYLNKVENTRLVPWKVWIMTLITCNLRFEACKSNLKVNRGDFCVVGIYRISVGIF